MKDGRPEDLFKQKHVRASVNNTTNRSLSLRINGGFSMNHTGKPYISGCGWQLILVGMLSQCWLKFDGMEEVDRA